MNNKHACRAALLCAITAAFSFASATNSFKLLPTFPNATFGTANAVSADGQTVVGINTVNSKTVAFRWTAPTGVVALQPYHVGSVCNPTAVNATGTVIVGLEIASGGSLAIEWTSPTFKPHILTPFSTKNPGGAAYGISHDGSGIAGWGYEDSGAYEGLRWISGSPSALAPEGTDSYSQAHCISGDGKVAAGWTYHGSNDLACKWTSANTPILLARNGTDSFSQASWVNGDGSILVGFTGPDSNHLQACEWNSTGIHLLGNLPGQSYGQAICVSDDGNVVGMDGQTHALFWTPQTKVVDLNAYLSARGVNLNNSLAWFMDGITPDGRTFCGQAISGTVFYPFLATIDIPPTLLGLKFSPTSVAAGIPGTGYVYLSSKVEADTTVQLVSANGAIGSVPASVIVKKGTANVAFKVTTHFVSVLKHLPITAILGSQTAKAVLTVTPPALSAITESAGDVTGGTTVTGHVYLDTKAGPTGASVQLSSDNACATVPSSVMVAAGTSSASFTITTHPVSTSTTAHITASYQSVNRQMALTVH